eukprot:GHVS01024558.1.p1 GENE.GHVS01024558.1~~GHVS01024558.1.p1  ORF type:complete len:116 (-),score=9.95 GHVS01024558.1:15-362(-)
MSGHSGEGLQASFGSPGRRNSACISELAVIGIRVAPSEFCMCQRHESVLPEAVCYDPTHHVVVVAEPQQVCGFATSPLMRQSPLQNVRQTTLVSPAYGQPSTAFPCYSQLLIHLK